jgi:hypothetical protein
MVRGRVTHVAGRAKGLNKGRVTRVRGRTGAFTVEARPANDTVLGLTRVELLVVAIDGPIPDSWTWTQLSGTAVTLAGSGPARQFEAPALLTTTNLVFQVVVGATGYSSVTVTITITVLPHAGLWQKVAGNLVGRGVG